MFAIQGAFLSGSDVVNKGRLIYKLLQSSFSVEHLHSERHWLFSAEDVYCVLLLFEFLSTLQLQVTKKD